MIPQALAEWLDPSRWTEAGVRNTVEAGAVFGASLGVAWATGRLVHRWLQRNKLTLSSELEQVESSVRRVVVLAGAYQAARALALQSGAASALYGLLFVVVVLAGARMVSQLTSLLLHGYLERTADGAARERAQREYLPIASTAATVAVALFAVILIAHHFGHDVSSLVTAFGVGSLAIGLAAQQTLGNMIAGFTLLIDRPFRPGDRIRLATGETGEVSEIGIRSTRIVLPEGSLLIVPNAELANSRVENRSHLGAGARGRVTVTVGREVEFDKVRAALVEAATAQPEVLAPPEVTIKSFGGRTLEVSVTVTLRSLNERDSVEDRIRLALARDIARWWH